MNLIGHQAIQQFFTTALAEHVLAQVYCFVGPSRIGKRTAAKQLAAELLAVEISRLEHHPDYTYIERLVDEKSGKLKKEVSVAQARELRGKLERRSWLGGYHVVIVNEAELLNEESSNALLKTLEEPAHKTVIMLLAENDTALLPTIRSRSQVFYFSPVPDQVLTAALVGRGYSDEAVASVIPLAVGRPGLALTLLDDEAFRATFYEELTRFRAMLGQPFGVKSAQIEALFKDKEEGGERQRERLYMVVDLWLLAWRTMLLAELGLPVSSSALTRTLLGVTFPVETIIQNVCNLVEVKAELRYNVNQRLLIEQALITF